MLKSLAWLQHDLMPKMPPGSVIVMDNATFHHRKDTKTMIYEARHILEYLPPYTPDLKPIKHKCAQEKTIRQTTGKITDFQKAALNQISANRLY